jgi:hypothetical protein
MKKTSKPNNLLSGLLDKVDETNKILATIKIPKKDTSRYEELEKKIRLNIKSFDDDKNLTKLELEPMTKEERYHVHDIVTNEYSNTLISISEGDQIDRHIVIYRKGFQPIETTIAPIVINKVTQKKVDRDAISVPVAPIQSFVKLNVEKRDRRTLEEIQSDMKAKKSKIET